MIKTNIQAMNVEELMEKIKAEVRRRRTRGETTSDHFHATSKDSKPASSPGIDFLDIGNIPGPEPFELNEEGYHINDFLKYHDLLFVTNAYRGILKRRPDSEGLWHFLEKLHSGGLYKAEILGRLRYSPEGRVKNVKIKGLLWNFVIQSSFRIPVLGYFSRLAVGLVHLPIIISNLNIFEANTFAQFQAHHNHMNIIADKVKFKINEIIEKYEQLEPILEQKADALALEALDSKKADALALEALDAKKADRDELRELDSKKADASALEALDAKKADGQALVHFKEGIEELLECKTNKDQVELIKDEMSKITRQTKDNKLNILDQQRRLAFLLDEARRRFPEPVSSDQIKTMLTEEDHLLDAMYVAFEDQFRGSRHEIKEKLKVYLPYLMEVRAGTKEAPVVDLGCGRGEWLELCQENNVLAIGIDINKLMVLQCKDFGFDVVESDLLSFLGEQKSNGLGAITGFHILEHLPFKTMISVIDETFRTLRPGGVAIFETPNPENLLVGAFSFYLDPSHRNPLVPESIKFFFEQRGFNSVRIERLHKNLQYFEDKPDNDFKNRWFYSEMDYAIIGYK